MGNSEREKLIGRSIRRVEDARFLTGRGRYVADIAGLGPMPCMAAVTPLIVPPRTALANGRVRHVGDPVAFIVADSEATAREAAERIEVEYESLPAIVDGRDALASGAPVIWDQVPGNA